VLLAERKSRGSSLGFGSALRHLLWPTISPRYLTAGFSTGFEFEEEVGVLTWKCDAEYKRRDCHNENNGRYPSHGIDVIQIDGHIARAPAGISFNSLCRSVRDRSAVDIVRDRCSCCEVVLLRFVVPSRRWQSETRNVAACGIEQCEIPMFRDSAIAVKSDDMICIRETLGCALCQHLDAEGSK